MSYRIVPAAQNSKTFQAGHHAPSVPGLHDTLRAGVGPSPLSSSHANATSSTPSADLTSAHPLEARLKNWEATQESMRMQTLRRTYGAAEPIRRQMELKITRAGDWRPAVLSNGSMGLHEEILRNKDTSIAWEDVYTGEEGLGGNAGLLGVHDEMERKLKM
ncbi:proteasome maturation factor UMP1 [Plectosphaerella plurivora]|uniref:Proteasome maturation factor UMP1 n=1 Tax=Plectosphaerella plurivora TaxID=936078 RepID=A0A9P8V116_9PEZI|nr:proteasome maturation factor UMP1 [Plectosphaerella plurivora]